MALFQTGPDRYQSDPDSFGNVDQKRIVKIVGIVALALPIVLWLASHNPVYATCFRFSISHFYYAPFWGTFFTGALFFIGTYLMVWQGEEKSKADGRMATRAGFSAFGVALFPTGGWGCNEESFSARPMADFKLPKGEKFPDLVPPKTPPAEHLEYNANAYFSLDFQTPILAWIQAEWIHYASALFMFSFLAWFAVRIFTRVDPRHRLPGNKLTERKSLRNTIYYFTGSMIILCIVALFVSFVLNLFPSLDPEKKWDAANLTFWFEAIALVSFGLSWMVKGQLFKSLNDDFSTMHQRVGAD
ncbi:MAG: hypothetical protein ABJD13_20585 [Paracoccaceae bacterium]